jgi:hypothetical protein
MNTRIEEALSKIEGTAVPGCDTLLQGAIPKPSQERMAFSHFPGLMEARTPAMRRMQAEIYGRGLQIQNCTCATNNEAFESLIPRVGKEPRLKIDNATKVAVRQRMIDPSGQTLSIPQELALSALKMGVSCAAFFDMKWSILRAKHGFFITSDNPLVREVDPAT